MNIGIDLRTLLEQKRTGVGEYTYELLQSLFERDTLNQYFLFFNSYKEVEIPEWNKKNVHIVRTHIPNKIFHIFQLLHLLPIDYYLEKMAKKKGMLKPEEKTSVFFSPNLHFTAVRSTTKHILMLHDLSFLLNPQWFSLRRRLWHVFVSPKRQAKKASALITPSYNTKRDVCREYGIEREKVHVLYPALSQALVQRKENMTDEYLQNMKEKYHLPQKYILFLGTLEPRKNICFAVEAFKISRLAFEGYQFIIAGSVGWKTKKIMRSLENAPGVRYIGYVDADEKPALYTLSQLFVYPSFYEGFGFPPLEAKYFHVKSLVSNTSSFFEVMGESGRFISPYNVTECSEAIKNEVGKKEEKNTNNFSWEKTSDEFLSLINTL
ncbi:MAG: glycosyltransferase family 1 protein [Candidatus Magasanikbacteria bacterium]